MYVPPGEKNMQVACVQTTSKIIIWDLKSSAFLGLFQDMHHCHVFYDTYMDSYQTSYLEAEFGGINGN